MNTHPPKYDALNDVQNTPPVSGVAPDLNTAVCKTSLMLQRPKKNLSTGAYPICKKVWGDGRGHRGEAIWFV